MIFPRYHSSSSSLLFLFFSPLLSSLLFSFRENVCVLILPFPLATYTRVTKAMDKKFCPSCGNATLMRTSCGTDANGITRYYLKKNYQYNLRGTKYNIPLPQGGRNSNEQILREDQREYVRALKLQRRKKEVGIFDLDYVPKMLSGSVGDKKPRGPVDEIVIGSGKKNPNFAKRRTGRKKH